MPMEVVAASKSARLEQQRDEARENNGRNAAMLTSTLIERDRARRQRDELLEALERIVESGWESDEEGYYELEEKHIQAARAAIAAVKGNQ
jgi:hypothetical protein